MFGRFFLRTMLFSRSILEIFIFGSCHFRFCYPSFNDIPEAVGRIRNPLSAGSMEQHFPSEHESGCFYLAVLLYRSIFGRTDLFRRLYRRNVEHVQRIRKEQSPRFYLYASGLGNGLFCR